MSVTIGTPLSQSARKVLLCGSGELGKEVAIELQRLGVEVIAADRYANAPAMQVAHRSYVISMLDGEALREVIEQEQPDLIVPEIEAIATDTLAELESEGFTVIPTAKAAIDARNSSTKGEYFENPHNNTGAATFHRGDLDSGSRATAGTTGTGIARVSCCQQGYARLGET